VALEVEDDAVPARGADVRLGDRHIGHVTSACASPTLGRVIALAVVETGTDEDGAAVQVGDRRVVATVRPVPLYDPQRRRPRA
jgi:glycine cleavage system aminomethyltransferase T